jgi:hypothetical protein
MHPEIKKYLDQMCREISNKQAKENARLEIENHFLDQIEALSSTGLTEEESVKRVLSLATNPGKLGTKLNLAHRPFLLRYPITFAISSLTFAAFFTVVAMSHFLVENHFLPLLKAHHDPVFEQKFTEDLEVLSLRGLPLVNSRNKNAMAFLSDKIDYENNPLSEKYKRLYKLMENWNIKDGRGKTKNPLRESQLVRRLIKHEMFTSLNDEWVDKILEYDHLNHFDDKRNKELIRNAAGKSGLKRINALSGYRIPELGLLGRAVIYRSIRKIHQGKTEEARILMLHAFSLIQSTNSLVGSNVAAQILIQHESLRTNFHLDWEEIPKRVRLAYRRVGWGWATIFNSGYSDPDSLKKWEKFFRPELGVCAGASEGQGTAGLFVDFFQEKAPLETDLGELVAKSKEVISSLNKLCKNDELALLHDKDVEEKDGLFTHEYLAGFSAGPESFIKKIPLNPSRIPYLRRVVGMFFMTVAIPQFQSIYTNQKEPEV